MVDELLAASAPQMTEDELEQRLLEKGFHQPDSSSYQRRQLYANRKPIEVEGKSVSEIIIEERR